MTRPSLPWTLALAALLGAVVGTWTAARIESGRHASQTLAAAAAVIEE